MATQSQQSRIIRAVEALKIGDRDGAVKLLKAELRSGPAAGERWKSVSRLAAQIGEIDIAIESARRFSQTPPPTLDRMLNYWGELAQHGRTETVRADLSRLPERLRQDPNVLHFCGTVAGQEGDFARSERF